ncbi:YjbE family putative metal transport protein [Cohnella sp. CFH 77786]|uniref:TerC family protein n=1 Tax=Cohnella sp. CFH 77786 TaxID=2662265 RepID=UPI001C60DCC7|nr:TerC family protein [Cohnella sp. CFH 77786]MBW5444858.1 YjbE family putative metal transport protein [Cohnella sp. CFH 77786]
MGAELLDRFIVFMEITLINLLLSGDNALVIAMTARRLPHPQRRRAVWWGAAAAVLLRCLLTWGAVAMLGIPFLQTAGALLLFVIALKLMLERGDSHDTRSSAVTGLAGAVWTIVAADFVMSLDNVLAVAAVADGDFVMLLIGIAMSIPMIIWGSAFIIRLLDRIPALSYVGGALLAYTAGEMMLHDEGLARVLPAMASEGQKAFPCLAAGVILAAALFIKRRRSA